MLVQKITPPLFQPYLICEKNRAFIEGRSNKVFTPFSGSILFSLLLISTSIGFMWTARGLYNKWIVVSSLIYSSTTTKGVVTNKSIVIANDDEDINEYYLTYEFVANNKQKIRKDISTNSKTYYKYARGDNISVRYANNNPFISRPYKSDIDMLLSLLQFSFFTLIPFFISITLSIFAIYQTRIALMFKYRKCEIIQGILVSASAQEDSDNDLDVTFNYDFNTPDGRKITNSITERRNDLKDKNLPPNGTQLAILYMNDKIYILL